MTRLQKLLLLPCLSPLAVALVVAVELRQPTALRLLTWRSGNLPMGRGSHLPLPALPCSQAF